MNKTLAKLLIVVVIFVGLWALIFKLPYFNVAKVDIIGIDNLTEDQVRSMITTTEGNNIFSFSTHICEKNIKNSHYAESVDVSRELPNKVVVNIKEYKLRGYVPYMGSYLYLDEEGRILDIQKGIKKQLPVVEGLKFENFTVGEILKVENSGAFSKMVELSKLFEKYELLGQVIRVDLTNTNDVHLFINKVDVEMGDMDDANKKILMLMAVLKQLDTNYAGRLNLTGDNATFEYLT